ncbi:unnamed protein product [Effrenium voratum]|nr:unnamed protein product [Effrenium voratum]
MVEAWERELQGYVAQLAQEADGLLQPGEDSPEEPEASPSVPAMDASSGSRGHPELCRRPCIYMRTGRCRQAEDCGFCHLDHEGTVKLDKRQREIMRSLSQVQLLATMLYYLRARGLRGDLLRLVEVELLAQEMTGSQALAEIPEKDRRRLDKTLARMSWAGLLGLASTQQVGADFRRRLAEATERLRQ